MNRTVTFDEALTAVMELPAEEQQQLLDIMSKRRSDARRIEIAANAKAARKLYDTGSLSEQSIDELLSDLHTSLE